MTRLARLTDRLNLKEFQLRALLDVTKAINNNVGRDQLLELYGRIMHDELGITRLMLFEKTGAWQCVQVFEPDVERQLPDVVALIERLKDIQFIGSHEGKELEGFDIAVPVYHRDQPLALLLIGDIDDEEQRMSPTVKHLNFIQTLTNLIVVALENKRFAKRALVEERNRRELELASDMQKMLIPRDLPDDERMQAAGWYLPHHQVGGDYYDVIRTGPDEVVFCVADVSGKGIAAALLMANFQATLRAMLQRERIPLEELVRNLNSNVLERARGERFITLFIGRADLRNGALSFINAGHNPPMLLRDGRVEELTSGCIALGMLPDLPFIQVGEASVSQCTLLCYTDGLVEQEDGLGNAFDTEPIRKALALLNVSGPRSVNEGLIAAFEAHRAGLPYLDDIALLTCHFS